MLPAVGTGRRIFAAGLVILSGSWLELRQPTARAADLLPLACSAERPTAECIVRVTVRADPGARGELPRETGAAFLLPDAAERAGYGLYSYLLLGAPPTDGTRDR